MGSSAPDAAPAEPLDPHPELPVDPDPSRLRTRGLHLQPRALLLVLAGGMIGTGCRLLLGQAWPAHAGSWPAATFTVNLVGAFVLGCLLEGLARAGDDSGWRRRARLLVGTGFCGSLTTYSTLAVDVVGAARAGASSVLLGYVIASMVGGFVLCLAGIAVAGAGARRRGAVR